MHIYIYISIYTCTYIYISIPIYTCIYIYIYISIYIYIHMHIYIYIHAHIYIHTHTHTHTHVHIRTSPRFAKTRVLAECFGSRVTAFLRLKAVKTSTCRRNALCNGHGGETLFVGAGFPSMGGTQKSQVHKGKLVEKGDLGVPLF